jgi:hypothetical protein
MTGPDPTFITAADWQSLSTLLAALWMVLGSALGFGGAMLLAHGMIPSLAASRDLPPDLAQKARLPLYAVAVIFLALALVSVFLFVDRLGAITSIYYHGME